MGKHDLKAKELQVNEIKSNEVERISVDNILSYTEEHVFEDDDLITQREANRLITNNGDIIDDTQTSTEKTWSSNKLNGILVTKADLVGGKVPPSQLPAYVDDVLEFANFSSLPNPGNSGIIYVTIDTNYEYRWSGSAYIRLVASPGSTDEVPEGITNKYFTQARAIASVLVGYVAGIGSIAVNAGDSILTALQKISGTINTKADIGGQVFTGNISAPNLSNVNTGDQDLSGLATKDELNKSASAYITVSPNPGQNFVIDSRLIGMIPKYVFKSKEYEVGGSGVTPLDNPAIVAFDTITGKITFDQVIYDGEDIKVFYSGLGGTGIIPGSVVLHSEFDPVKVNVDKLAGSIFIDTDGSFNLVDEGGWISLQVTSTGIVRIKYLNLNGQNVDLSDLVKQVDIAVLKAMADYFKLYDDSGNLYFTDELGNIGMQLSANGTLIVKAINSSTLIADQVIPGEVVFGTMSMKTNPDYALLIDDDLGNIAFSVGIDGSVTMSTATKKRIFGMLADVNHFITYGQSLSVGVSGTPIVTNTSESSVFTFTKGPYMLPYDSDSTRYNSLILEIENGIETPVGSMARMIKQQIVTDGFNIDGTSKVYDLLVSAPGQGGASIAQISKGTANYNRLLEGVIAGKNLAAAAGKNYNFPAIFFVQGESNYFTDRAIYKESLIKLRNDINADIKSITGQSNDVIFLNYQPASFNAYSATATIPMLLLDMGLNTPGFYAGPPLYPYTHGDQVHLLGPGYAMMGSIAGYIMKRIIIDGIEWKPINVTSHSISGNALFLNFYTPVSPLVFDTTLINNPGNYGFRLFDSSGTEITTITSVTIPRPNTVKIVSSAPITAGMRLTYAINGAPLKSGPIDGARGCLRDSQGNTLKYQPTGLNYPMHNWCPIFERYL